MTEIVKVNGRIAVDLHTIGAITMAKNDSGLAGITVEYCLNVKSKSGGDLVAVRWSDEDVALRAFNALVDAWMGA